jgi:hypothetical protein
MTENRLPIALHVLQWMLALVIIGESLRFAFAPEAAHASAKTGLPDFIRRALAWAEIAAAVLFLVPRTVIAGGWFLIGVLAFAIVLHLLHGWFDVGALLVYVAVAWAVLKAKSAPTEKRA